MRKSLRTAKWLFQDVARYVTLTVGLLVAVLGKLYGRGATDDKGPVAGWVNALEAFQKTNQVRHPHPAATLLCCLLSQSGTFCSQDSL